MALVEIIEKLRKTSESASNQAEEMSQGYSADNYGSLFYECGCTLGIS